VVAQVNKKHAAVVALTEYPAGEAGHATGIFCSQLAACMCSELVHNKSP
jgi:hypothetical protein